MMAAIGTALRPLIIRMLGLAAIFAINVLAGCSSPASSLPGTAPNGANSSTSGRLSGTLDGWVNAVCDRGRGPQPLVPGRYMGGATNPIECFATMQAADGGRMGPVPILIGTYTSESAMANDLGSLGAYAEGQDGNEYIVFAAPKTLGPALAAESAMFQPLQAYGFDISPSPNPLFEPPPLQPAPASTDPAPAPTALPPAAGNGRQIPPDADPQGFVGYPDARCNDTNPAVAIGRTADSVVVICQTGIGRLYYKGVGLQNGLSVEVDDPVPTGATFVATNNGVQYSLSPTALIITQGSTVLSNEPMLEYWSA